MVFQEADLSVRVVRDIFSAEFERAIVDDEKQHQRLKSFFTRTAPELLERVELYKDDEPLFERYGVDEVIQSTLNRRVDLPSGGYLMIDYAEAMTVIDVNSGSFTGPRQGRAPRGHDHEDQPRGGRGGRPPAAAARHRRDHRHRLHRHGAGAQPRRGAEDAAQGARRGPHQDLRGGDLAARAGRDDAPERDRRRARDPDQDLPDLRRRGRGALRGDGRDRGRAQAARPRLRSARSPVRISSRCTRGSRPCWSTARGGRSSSSRRRPASTSTSRARRRCRSTTSRWRWRAPRRRWTSALPFREGEEVLVTIEEPHMYNEDDAVAKIDGYVISVTGAGLADRREAPGADRPSESAAPRPRRRARRGRRRARTAGLLGGGLDADGEGPRPSPARSAAARPPPDGRRSARRRPRPRPAESGLRASGGPPLH